MPPGSPAPCVPVSPRLLAPTARHCSSQPHLCPGQPSSSSLTLEQNLTSSSKLDTWPSSSSLSPSIKTLPSIRKTSAGGHVSSRIHNSLSSRGSNPSSNVDSVSPYSSRTPIRSLHLSPIPRERSTSSVLSSCSLVQGRSIEVSTTQLPLHSTASILLYSIIIT